jgi:hypothetical protein
VLNDPKANFPQGSQPKTQDIVAAQRIIADISTGVYRSPAAAIKELVSNAFDADATKVSIATDAPRFRTLVVEDNGVGMSIDKFLDVMQHIGGSNKRITYQQSEIFKRPLIGRIGIGLLAVAQLGNRFYVSSSQRGKAKRFLAEINLEPYHKDAAALTSMQPGGERDEVHIGAIKYVDDIPEEANLHYTVITIPDAKKGIFSELTGLVRKAVGAEEVLAVGKSHIKTFREVVDTVQASNRADSALDGYYYMLWELGLICPLNYLPKSPFDSSKRKIINASAIQIPKIKNFSVEVDGIELKRPQRFPNKVAEKYGSPDPIVIPIEYDRKIAGRRLALSGYVYLQQPRIQPEELKGVHIRIRNVGIGNYDKSWLGYPFNEGQKFGQITGEIYVDEGLEAALNIDRDSFRETDVHYQALKAYIWNLLRKKVFPEFKQRQKRYTESRKQRFVSGANRRFSRAISELAAPMTGAPEIRHAAGPTLLAGLKNSKKRLLLDASEWKALINRYDLAKDAEQRLMKVLQALASAEILHDFNEDEFEPLVRALALAVQ